VKVLVPALLLTGAALVMPSAALARQQPAANDPQSNVPGSVRQAEQATEVAARRFRAGVDGGIGLDPESIMFGAHGTFGPLFRRGIDFRPGIEFGVGEVTTQFGINLDVLYALPGTVAARWRPYVGAGPNFALSHRGFETDDVTHVTGVTAVTDARNRFDFSDTDFEGGMNFIAGVRSRGGMTMEMRATAYGVTNVRLLLGYTF
jgi:hypothetical protein